MEGFLKAHRVFALCSDAASWASCNLFAKTRKLGLYFSVLSSREIFFIILNSSCTYHGIRATVLHDEKIASLMKPGIRAAGMQGVQNEK